MQQATIWNPNTTEKKVINVGDAMPTGFSLWTGGTATGQEAKQAIIDKANPVAPVVKPIDYTQKSNNIDSETLKAGMSSPDYSSNLPSSTASNEALKTYTGNTLSDATKTSADIQTQIDNIKAQQIKDAQANVEKANKAVEDYNAGVEPAITAYKENLTNQSNAISSVYTTDYYKSLLNDKKSITDEIIGYSKLVDDAINTSSGGATLASVATGRKNAVIADFTSKIAVKQAALTAIDGNFSLASSILDTGITKLNDYYTNQINFQKLAQEVFKTSDIKDLTDKAITDLETKQKSLETTKTAIQTLMSDPDTAIVVQKANILLTDTADEVTTKLNTFYAKNPQYSPDNIKTNQALIAKYPDAGIVATDTSAIVQSKLANSKIYQNETNNKNNYLEFTDPSTGEKKYYDTASNTWVSSSSASDMRTDRNNNPTAMTTSAAKSLGLVEGVDYTQGDSFTGSDGKTYYTAKLLGNAVDTTIKALDTAANNPNTQAFYSQNGNQRWSHTAMTDQQWLALTPDQKKATVASMYQKEGGNGSLIDNGNNFNFTTDELRTINNAISAGLLSKDATGKEKYDFLNKNKNLSDEEKSFQTDLNKALDDLAKGGDWGDNWNYLQKRYNTPNDVLDQLLQKDKYNPVEKKSGGIVSLWNKFWGK